MKPPNTNIFLLKPSWEQKSNFVPNGIQIGFKWQRKMCTNRQTDIFVFITVENNNRSLNWCPASNK